MIGTMPVRITVREAGVSDSPDDLAILDAGERTRAGRKREAAPFVTGHALVRRVLGEVLDRDPAALEFARRCATCGSAATAASSLRRSMAEKSRGSRISSRPFAAVHLALP